jgi:hypothetical protein
METINDEMVEITTNGQTIQVNKMIFHFIEFLKLHGDDVSDITTIINKFQSFLDYWEDFKKSEKEATYNNKHLQRFNLFHTIKPKTEYAHQQQIQNGKPLLYPIYRITNGTVYSMASGGNYPLKDCILYLGDGTTIAALK